MHIPPASALAGSLTATTGAPRTQPNASAATSVQGVPGDVQRQREYSHGKYALDFAGTALQFLILWLLLQTGLSHRMRDLARRVTRRPTAVVLVYFALFVVLTSVLALPLTLYADFVREHRFGFSHQTLGQWFGDFAKALALSSVLGGGLVAVLYALIRRFPKRFWIALAGISVAFAVVIMVIAPVFIAPLFNRFTPLPESPLKRSLLDLAHSQGIPAHQVYVVDASRQSSHGNAYVAGLFGTERIVIYDTLLERDTPAEIRAVMGHEMGHYVLHHVGWGLVLFALMAVCATAALRPLDLWFIRRFGARWHIEGIDDVAGLPLIALILGVMGFLSTPLVNAFSRHEEHEADAFSLRVVRDPDALASAFEKFAVYDLSEYDPPKWIEWWSYAHPSLKERVEFCRVWKREHGG